MITNYNTICVINLKMLARNYYYCTKYPRGGIGDKYKNCLVTNKGPSLVLAGFDTGNIPKCPCACRAGVCAV